jgi:hypothetical protein
MKTKILTRLLIAFSFSAILSISIALACGGWDEDWNGYSNFAPEPHADKAYLNLFYTDFLPFYDGYEGGYVERFNIEILNDWKGFLDGKMSDDNISFLLLNPESVKVVEDLNAFITKKVKIGAYNEWSNKIDLNNSQIKSFIEFLFLAKEVQKSTVDEYGYWDYDEKKDKVKIEASVVNQIKSKYQSENNSFLKNRYWFQTVKAYFYSDKRDEGKSFIESTITKVSKNNLYYRALSYLAGIYYASGNYAQSNYLFSVVFANCDAMSNTAIYCFHPQEESDWNATLAMAKNDEEKSALWAMLGFYADESRAIDEIHKINPKNKYLDFLLTRLINKTEKKVAYLDIETADKYRSAKREKLSNSELKLVSSIAESGKTAKPYFWNMAAGYLYSIDGDYSQARQFLDKSEKQLPSGQQYKDQLRLLKLINNLCETNVMDKNAENKLLSDLNWLYNELPKSASETFRYQQALSWSKLYIAALYRSANNPVFEEMFQPKKAFYHNETNLEAMKTLQEKTNMSAFEKMVTGIYYVSAEDIYEYQAVRATFNNNITLAYELMQKAGTLGGYELKANPFNGFIQDCHDCEHAMAQKTKFSKLRFIEVIKIMQEKVAKGEDLFNNYLLLGNAFYNITYYGNARGFYEGDIMGADMHTFYDIEDTDEANLTSMDNAKSYYVLALKAAKTDEQKAKCHYLLSKCERNDFYNGKLAKKTLNSGSDFLEWTGFKKLKDQYSKTKYYQEVIKECGYFATYMNNR